MLYPITFFIFLSYYDFDEYSLMFVWNRMSKRLKSVMKKLFEGRSSAGRVDTLFQDCSTVSTRASRDAKTRGSVFGGSTYLLSERRGNLFIFIPFSNMNLLTSLHSIFQHEESLRREEEVEAMRLEEEDLDEDGGQDSEEDEEEEEGHKGRCRAVQRGGGGDGSASGPASSCRVRTSHLIHPPVAPREENGVVIVPSGDG
jgi:hypothetical protein